MILEWAAQGYCLVSWDGCHRGQGCEAEEAGYEGGQEAACPQQDDDAEEAEQEVRCSQGGVEEAGTLS